MTLFTVDPYTNPVDSTFAHITGRLSPTVNGLYGKIDRGPRAVFVSRQLDFHLLKLIKPDILITDYAYDLAESTEFKQENFASIPSDVYIQLPAFTANIKRFYARDLFDEHTGEPISSLVGERIGTHDYTVHFWEPEWRLIIDEFLQRISRLKPQGLFVRGLDRGHGNEEAIKLLTYIASKALKYGIEKVIAETIHFLGHPTVIKNVHGVSVPGFFYTDPQHRTSLQVRLERQALLDRFIAQKKEVFIMDRVEDQFLELIARSRSRKFIPVLKVETENGILNEELIEPHRQLPVFLETNRWEATPEDLYRGTNRIEFVTPNSFFNRAFIDFRPLPWSTMIKTADFTALDADPCTTTLGSRFVHSKDQKSTNDFLLQLRKDRLGALDIPKFIPRSHFLLSSFSSDFFEQWIGTPELKPLLDRFTYPIVLSRGKKSIHARIGENSAHFAESARRSDGRIDHRLLIIRGYHDHSSIVLCFGDTYAIKTLSYILDNIETYAPILDDEEVTLVIARTAAGTPEEYIPTFSNIHISPLADNLK